MAKQEYRQLVRTPRQRDFDNPHPLYVVWELTLKCDLGCKHCGSRAGFARSNELTTAECMDMVHQLAGQGVREVTVIGGEAYLRPDWTDIVAELTKCGIVVTMTTGARNLTPERLDKAIKAGLKGVSISLDGLEATHDAQRGVKGSWRAATETMKRVADSPLRLTTNTQVNRLSLPELVGVADTMAELGSRGWQVQITVAMGRAADRPELLLQPYHLLEMFPLLVWIKQNILDPNDIRLAPGNNVGYFGPYEEILRYGGDLGAHWAGCPAGKWGLGIEADGAVKGCPSLASRDYTGGNIRNNSLADIVANSPEVTYFKNRTAADLWGFCGSCYYADICLGGCSWTSHSLLGREGNNPYCIYRALDFEKRGLRERVVKVEQAPGKPFDRGRYEIVEEPMPNAEEATFLGVDVQEVIAMRSKDKGVWTPETIRERLTQA